MIFTSFFLFLFGFYLRPTIVLLEAQEVAEQCVIIVLLNELSCCSPVSRVQTSPDSTTSFDAMSITRRRKTPPGTGRVEQFGKDD